MRERNYIPISSEEHWRKTLEVFEEMGKLLAEANKQDNLVIGLKLMQGIEFSVPTPRKQLDEFHKILGK